MLNDTFVLVFFLRITSVGQKMFISTLVHAQSSNEYQTTGSLTINSQKTTDIALVIESAISTQSTLVKESSEIGWNIESTLAMSTKLATLTSEIQWVAASTQATTELVEKTQVVTSIPQVTRWQVDTTKVVESTQSTQISTSKPVESTLEVQSTSQIVSSVPVSSSSKMTSVDILSTVNIPAVGTTDKVIQTTHHDNVLATGSPTVLATVLATGSATETLWMTDAKEETTSAVNAINYASSNY